MTTVIKKFSNMLFAFVLCAGLVMTSCETADPAGKDPNNSDIIVFADPIVKQSCVYVFDTDGDGEISYGEAAAVTDLSDITLRLVKEFLTFDEFQYFINVKSIPNDLFKECNYLESIVLPKSIQTIGSNAFRDCTSLTNIEFSEGLETIGKQAFQWCTGLTRVYCKPLTPPVMLSHSYLYPVFGNDCRIYVPHNSIELYKVAEYWKDYEIVGYDF